MTENAPEAPTQATPTEESVLSPEDVRHDPPTNKGSGQFAVWDSTLGQYVSGVGDKAGATASKKALEESESFFNGAPLEGHTLEVREV